MIDHSKDHQHHNNAMATKEHSIHNHDQANHHLQMAQDFKIRFIISVIVTIPILLLSPLIQELLNFRLIIPAESYILFTLSSFIFSTVVIPF